MLRTYKEVYVYDNNDSNPESIDTLENMLIITLIYG